MADEEMQVSGNDSAAQPGDAWGDPISEERQAELRALFERQQVWAAQPEATRGNSVFKDVWLKGADVSWLALQSLERTGDEAAMTPAQFASNPKAQPVILRPLYIDFDHWPSVPNLHLEGATLRGAHLEGARIRGAHLEHATLMQAHLEGANFRQAHLEGANLWGTHLLETLLEEAHLERATLRGAHLERARLEEAHLENSYLQEAHLKDAHLDGAYLERAHLEGTNLEGAHLEHAHLEGANLKKTRLERVNLSEAHLEGANFSRAHLEGANLTRATFDKTTHLTGAVLTGATLDQVTYDGVNLTVVDWSLVPVLGDDVTARQREGKDGTHKDREQRLEEFTAAVRANRVLAVTLRSQGMNEDADRFAYCHFTDDTAPRDDGQSAPQNITAKLRHTGTEQTGVRVTLL